MRAPHLTPPIQLSLPGGIVADYVPESDPPQYIVGGELLAVDVVIPEDLAQAGWFWWGSFLAKPAENGVGVSISTASFPPPGWNYTTAGRILVPGFRLSCYTAARQMEIIRAEHEAQRLSIPPKKAKRTKTAPAPAQVVQAVMEL